MRHARVLLCFAFVAALCSAALAQGLIIPEHRGPIVRPIAPLAIKSYTVDVKIKDATAVTTVTEVFVNESPRRIEGTFLFPLPRGAAISKFEMEIDGKMVAGELLDKQRAQQIYNDIVRKMRDPAILEYAGRNLFRVRIFPIEPNSEKRIRLRYSQVLEVQDNIVRYVHPMNLEKLSKRPIKTVALSVDIESTMGIKSVYSPSHEIDEFRDGDNRCRVGFEASDVLPVRDFTLFYTLSNEDFGMHVLTYRPKGEDGYFMLMVAPKQTFSEQEILNKNVVFVLDVSGSMQSDGKIAQAKQALKYCLESLKQGDRFNIIAFSTGVDTFAEGLLPAESPTIARAKEYLDKLVARGGTFISGALRKALEGIDGVGGTTMIVFLTDGLPTVGERSIDKLVQMVDQLNGYDPQDPKSTPRSRIFCFGVGYDVNTHLLDLIADHSRGYSQYVPPGEDVEVAVSSFYEKISHPVLANIRIDFGKIHAYDYYPQKLPDLFKGSELRIFGRYRGEGDVALKLMGRMDGRERAVVADAKFPARAEENEFIAQLWAVRRVAHLLNEIRLHGESKELKDEIVALGKRWGIVTPYTSYIVLEGRERLRLRPLSIDAARRPPAPAAGLARIGTAGRVLEDQAGGLLYRGAGGAAQGGYGAPRGEQGPPGQAGPQAPSAAYSEAQAEAYGKALLGSASRPAEQTGRIAVDLAAQLERIRNAEVQQVVANVRTVAGRTFYLIGERWVQAEVNEKTEIIRVRYLSPAYFQLAAQPGVAQCLALGPRVIVVLEGNVAIEIADDESARSEPFSAEELARLFPQREN